MFNISGAIVEARFQDQDNRLLSAMAARKAAAETVAPEEAYVSDAMSVTYGRVDELLQVSSLAIQNSTEALDDWQQQA